MLREIQLLGIVVAALSAAACGGSDGSGLASGGSAGSAGVGGSGGTGAAGGSAGDGGSGGSIGGPCESNDDCSAGVCDEVAGACVECLFETDCEGDARCTANHCIPNTECVNSLDCVDAPAGPICDPVTSTCEECVEPSDCDGTADCVEHRCVTFTACKNSLDCQQGQVCDPQLERCVECVESADCGEGETCVASQCKTLVGCQSDNQCTPLGQLCDKALGVCVDCLKNSDCPSAYHCAGGGCALDACAEGSSRCTGDAVESCLPDGVGWGAAVACTGASSCVQAGAQASCVPWECTPDSDYCASSEHRKCASDGLSSSLVEDCSSQGLNCVSGACSAQVCAPNELFCEGGDVKLCDATGSSSSLSDDCSPTEWCDDLSASCKAQVCSPNQPACDGEIATTCNASGSGYTTGGTNCAASGKSCVDGACQACAPGSAVRQLRLTEVYLGTGDYVVIKNRSSTCSAQLQGVTLSALTSNSSATTSFPLPSHSLAPGASVRVLESDGIGQTGDLYVSGSISWVYSADGAALLCQGATCSAANVIDAMVFTAKPTTVPAGINFSPGPLTSINTVDLEDTSAYLRVAYSGAAPSFQASDWTMGSASLPLNANQCPATQPVNGSSCTQFGQSCVYGAVTCSCSFITWDCM